LYADSTALIRQVGLDVDPRTPLGRLTPAQQQLVEVAKALSLRTRLLILDEPTAALTERETKKLFEIIGKLKSEGIAVIYISHRLEEIFQIADRVTVLKDGRLQATLAVRETSSERLISLMVGRAVAESDIARNPPPDDSPVALDVRSLSDRTSRQGGPGLLQGISFVARQGEIVVLSGLAGAGRTELALSLFGARDYGTGDVYLNDRRVRFRSPSEAVAAGLGYLPEDRKEAGLFLQMSIAANVVAAGLARLGGWWVRDRQRDRLARRYASELNIAARSVRQSLIHLSGGNQQKVLLAKWLLVAPRVLIVDEPTRGIDVGAKAEVHSLLYRLSRQGTAVIVISSDLMEVLAVADRIVVLHEGVVTGELDRGEATEERIMHLASLGAPA
jgi:ABC-type sugar transport system ATPase subunit